MERIVSPPPLPPTSTTTNTPNNTPIQRKLKEAERAKKDQESKDAIKAREEKAKKQTSKAVFLDRMSVFAPKLEIKGQYNDLYICITCTFLYSFKLFTVIVYYCFMTCSIYTP